jgi:hypothetical protein
MLNPMFSPSHMRALTPTFNDLAEQASTAAMPCIFELMFPYHSSARYSSASS